MTDKPTLQTALMALRKQTDRVEESVNNIGYVGRSLTEQLLEAIRAVQESIPVLKWSNDEKRDYDEEGDIGGRYLIEASMAFFMISEIPLGGSLSVPTGSYRWPFPNELRYNAESHDKLRGARRAYIEKSLADSGRFVFRTEDPDFQSFQIDQEVELTQPLDLGDGDRVVLPAGLTGVVLGVNESHVYVKLSKTPQLLAIPRRMLRLREPVVAKDSIEAGSLVRLTQAFVERGMAFSLPVGTTGRVMRFDEPYFFVRFPKIDAVLAIPRGWLEPVKETEEAVAPVESVQTVQFKDLKVGQKYKLARDFMDKFGNVWPAGTKGFFKRETLHHVVLEVVDPAHYPRTVDIDVPINKIGTSE